MLGQTISHYEILELIGRGGMGVVYKARDTKLERFVAMKFLPPELTDTDRVRTRFIQEAQAASALEHPNICVIHEIDETPEGQMYMVMAYYPGDSLRQRISESPLTVPETARIGLQIAQGLSKAHRHAIVHRDIKPANVLLTDEGHIKIVDFGVAKLSDRPAITREGGVVGTVVYMSPQQVRGTEVDARADLWSLGVVMHEMITGKLPFRGGHEQAIVYSILNEEPHLRSLHRHAGHDMVQVIARCLEKDLDQRWQDADQLGTALRDIVLGSSEEDLTLAAPGAEDETAVLPTALIAVQPVTPDFSQIEVESELFVGRNQEIDRLATFLDTTLNGRGQVALVRGEAGQGKTSLVREFCRRAETNHLDLIVCSGKCNAQTGNSDPYHPFREVLGLLSGDFQLSCASGLVSRQSAERLWRLVPRSVDALVELGPDLIDTFIPGRPLLSRSRPTAPSGAPWIDRLERRIDSSSGEHAIRPEQSDLFDQYARVLQVIAQQGPLVLLLEDLQWADPGSIELMTQLSKTLAGSPTLILGTYRKEDLTSHSEESRHPLEPVINELKRGFGDIEVDLDKSDGQVFIDDYLDSWPNKLSLDFREALFRQTAGLPLFTVELLNEMRDKGLLGEDDEGKLAASDDLNWDLVPARAEAVVAERIERLPEVLRTLLTICCVEGEEFTSEVVARVQDVSERDTARLLSSDIAKKHGLVSALSVGRINGKRITRYRFRNRLYQKYLYAQLDEVEQSFLHEEVGNHLEELYGDRVREEAPKLARHFELAGMPEKTIEYLRLAARGAARLSANLEVIEILERAVAQLDELPAEKSRDQLELDIRSSLSSALIAVKGFTSPEVEANNVRSQELCEKLPDSAGFELLWTLFAFDSVRADFIKSLPIAEQMVRVAERAGNPIQLLQANYAKGVTEIFHRHFDVAAKYLAKVISVKEEGLGEQLSLIFAQDSRKVALGHESFMLLLRGDAEKAAVHAEEAIAWARQDPHPFTLSTVLLLTSFTRLSLGEIDAVAAAGREILALSEEYSLFQTREGNLVIGLAEARRGGDGSTETLEKALEEYRASGSRVFLPFYMGHLAEAHLDAGRAETAAPLLNEALEVAAEGGDRLWEPELLRLQDRLTELTS